MKRILYHGSNLEIQHPDVTLGRPNLDFGRGFYLTDLKIQAEKWALIVQQRNPMSSAILNTYELDDEFQNAAYKMLHFKSYDIEWLDFIVKNRAGFEQWKEYDLIEGGIANDRVIDTVEAYMSGNMTADIALKRLAEHQPNNQLCILNQSIVDKYLAFVKKEVVNA